MINRGSRLQAMQKYNEAPWYWYALLLILAFVAGTHQDLCFVLNEHVLTESML